MKILLQRFHDDGKATLGLLYADGMFRCFTLEDTYREIKIPGETRIPAGEYGVSLVTAGRLHDEYLKKFGPAFHKGMLYLHDVPGFEGIEIHIGNTAADTHGCLLVGSSFVSRTVDEAPMLDHSTDAYKRIYPILAAGVQADPNTTILVADEVRIPGVVR